jgi:hypothetical protein
MNPASGQVLEGSKPESDNFLRGSPETAFWQLVFFLLKAHEARLSGDALRHCKTRDVQV